MKKQYILLLFITTIYNNSYNYGYSYSFGFLGNINWSFKGYLSPQIETIKNTNSILNSFQLTQNNNEQILTPILILKDIQKYNNTFYLPVHKWFFNIGILNRILLLKKATLFLENSFNIAKGFQWHCSINKGFLWENNQLEIMLGGSIISPYYFLKNNVIYSYKNGANVNNNNSYYPLQNMNIPYEYFKGILIGIKILLDVLKELNIKFLKNRIVFINLNILIDIRYFELVINFNGGIMKKYQTYNSKNKKKIQQIQENLLNHSN